MENTFKNNNIISGKVYKLYCKDENIKDCYIGSSIDLNGRLQKHKSNSHNENSPKYNLTVYKKIRECGGWNNWKCDILDEIENPTRKQLIALERIYYEEHIDTATLNTFYCGRTKKEGNKAWWKKNPDYMLQYREKNEEKLKKYNKNYYDKNCEKIKNYYKEKVHCQCGCVVSKGAYIKHLTSRKHKKLMVDI